MAWLRLFQIKNVIEPKLRFYECRIQELELELYESHDEVTKPVGKYLFLT